MNFKLAIISALALVAAPVSAGPIAYGICQTGKSLRSLSYMEVTMLTLYWTGCNTVVVACYAAAGFTFGTVAAPLAPPAIVACNAGLGTCSAACATVALLAPTP